MARYIETHVRNIETPCHPQIYDWLYIPSEVRQNLLGLLSRLLQLRPLIPDFDLYLELLRLLLSLVLLHLCLLLLVLLLLLLERLLYLPLPFNLLLLLLLSFINLLQLLLSLDQLLFIFFVLSSSDL